MQRALLLSSKIFLVLDSFGVINRGSLLTYSAFHGQRWPPQSYAPSGGYRVVWRLVCVSDGESMRFMIDLIDQLPGVVGQTSICLVFTGERVWLWRPLALVSAG